MIDVLEHECKICGKIFKSLYVLQLKQWITQHEEMHQRKKEKITLEIKN